ncbi:mpv17-like protein [Schistocerca nitens]|uniref:mpv17-like protein n=1 Tax=Schistocerca nitens TaxID=7011 RepID=UPI0021197591|nr:mpv17-like protein [Schistocerca nitens]XP_049808059.1 mpv17-like protein [Schistocerca nitens]
MNSFVGKLSTISRKYPLLRGMASYAVIWPASSLCQQTISGKEHYDYMQVLRYGLFGTLFVAPTLHTWMKLAAEMWPSMTVKSAIAKAVVEQFSYGPAACICFFYGMSLLEGKSMKEAAFEVQTKFVPTYKYGVLIWPVAATINYTFVPERNRVPFISLCSFLWTNFLAFMKELEAKRLLQLKKPL